MKYITINIYSFKNYMFSLFWRTLCICVHRRMTLSISAISFVLIPFIMTSLQLIAFVLYSETIFIFYLLLTNIINIFKLVLDL